MINWARASRARSIRRRATTLLEMLVVTAVIGIMVTMLLPSLRRSMDMASSVICMNNLRSVGQSLAMYRNENDGWLPTEHAVTPSVTASGESTETWFQKLFPTYLNDPLILTCPEDPYRYRMIQARNTWTDPAVADYVSYGLNSFILSAGGGVLADLDRHKPTRPLNTILAADLGPDQGGRTKQAHKGPHRNKGFLALDDGFDWYSAQKNSPWLTTRHRGGINMMTLDGSVRGARTTEVLRRPVGVYYSECASGGCTFCDNILVHSFYHYSFAQDALFWWTGPVSID